MLLYWEKKNSGKVHFWLARRFERNSNHKAHKTKTRMKRWFGLIDATGSLLFFFVLDCYRQTDCTIEMSLNADRPFQFWMSDISQPNIYL